MECNNKEKCANYPVVCGLCHANSDIYNHYPGFVAKRDNEPLVIKVIEIAEQNRRLKDAVFLIGRYIYKNSHFSDYQKYLEIIDRLGIDKNIAYSVEEK